MNIFIKKALGYLFLLGIVTTILIGLLQVISNQSFKAYSFESKITTLFAGDSHVSNAFDDSKISNGKNIGLLAESYYFTYYKLRSLLEHNPIKQVYLGVGCHNMSSYYDDFIAGQYTDPTAAKYFPSLPKSEKIKLFSIDGISYASFAKHILEEEINGLVFSPSAIGDFDNGFVDVIANKASMDKRIKFQFYKGSQERSFSKSNIEYLQKIIDLCKEKKVNLKFVTTPLHPYYENKIPQKFKKKLNEIATTNNISLLRFQNLDFQEDEFIPDGDHVSVKGAIKTTKSILEDIQG